MARLTKEQETILIGNAAESFHTGFRKGSMHDLVKHLTDLAMYGKSTW